MSEAIVLQVEDDAGKVVGHYGVIAGDIFETITGSVNAENGWKRVKINQADFASLIRNRAKRTRFNALTGEDLTAPPA